MKVTYSYERFCIRGIPGFVWVQVWVKPRLPKKPEHSKVTRLGLSLSLRQHDFGPLVLTTLRHKPRMDV